MRCTENIGKSEFSLEEVCAFISGPSRLFAVG
jgi:hypothetical protein